MRASDKAGVSGAFNACAQAAQHARAGRLAQFLEDSGEAAELASSFAGLWSLDDDDADAELVRDAVARPEAYVLKPQREGGGNNLYGARRWRSSVDIDMSKTTCRTWFCSSMLPLRRFFLNALW